MGARANCWPDAPAGRLARTAQPFLSDSTAQLLRTSAMADTVLDATFAVHGNTGPPSKAHWMLCASLRRSSRKWRRPLLIISDRATSETRAPIPMLLAVSAVHNHLLKAGFVAKPAAGRSGRRARCASSGLSHRLRRGRGHPYLALAAVRHCDQRQHSRPRTHGDTAALNYIHAAEKGLLKIMSKMGIATLDAYHGAQVFECIGLDAR